MVLVSCELANYIYMVGCRECVLAANKKNNVCFPIRRIQGPTL